MIIFYRFKLEIGDCLKVVIITFHQYLDTLCIACIYLNIAFVI